MTSTTATSEAAAPSRRERLRHELTEAIKAVALTQLAEGGPSAVTLRGIAREVGVSPAALYGYFESLDDLFTALIADGFTDLARSIEDAIAAHEGEPVQDRLFAAILANRQWALDNMARFRLLYYSPVPGYTAPEEGPTLDASLRVSAAFLALFAEAWENGLLPEPEPGLELDCSKFDDRFGITITSDQMRVAIGAWGELHGMISLEVNNHIHAQWVDPEELFDATMRTLLRTAGLPAPSPSMTAASERRRRARR